MILGPNFKGKYCVLTVKAGIVTYALLSDSTSHMPLPAMDTFCIAEAAVWINAI